MTNPVPLVEVWRGDLLESFHFGHAVVCDGDGQIVEAWGDPDAVVYPRSSAKMIQALPLVTSGAAEQYGLGPEQLALASASHSGADLHVTAVQSWVEKLGLSEADFCCGPQTPKDRAERERLIRADLKPSQFHNNCSGKHAGFLTLNHYLGGGADYTAVDHPVQQRVRATFDELTGETSQHVGLDGCSAPNFSASMRGMARAMAWYATAHLREDAQSRAAVQIRNAMMAHPDLVAGEGRACTRLMRAMGGKGAVKTGAEAYFIAILPEIEKGVALKITDGGTRAAECAIAAILVRLGVLDADHPDAQAFVQAPITNWRGLKCGEMRPAAALLR